MGEQAAVSIRRSGWLGRGKSKIKTALFSFCIKFIVRCLPSGKPMGPARFLEAPC